MRFLPWLMHRTYQQADVIVAVSRALGNDLAAIARALAMEPRVLLFDEPTRGIDVGAKAEIYRMLQELAAQGKAIVVISSELEEVLRLSHRIIVMCEGRVTGELDGRTATQEEIMTLATQRQERAAA